MVLFKYFAIKDKLPSPNGSLSASIPSLSIAAANAQVRKIVNDSYSENKSRPCCSRSDLATGLILVKRGIYAKYPPQT